MYLKNADKVFEALFLANLVLVLQHMEKVSSVKRRNGFYLLKQKKQSDGKKWYYIMQGVGPAFEKITLAVLLIFITNKSVFHFLIEKKALVTGKHSELV